MKYLFAAALLASAFIGFSDVANAAGGCGPGMRPAPHGRCVRAGGPAVVVVPARPVVVVAPHRCPPRHHWHGGACVR
ncbi:MAG: hypothetical protein FWD68_10795 [Alphaproteobacteria bacterium]|nr:hypothetical protein [Alphaproteobacteria bacterium]